MKTLSILAIVVTMSAPVLALARPFTPEDLLMLSRIGHPTVSPDGQWLAWDQRETDAPLDKGHAFLWRLNLSRAGAVPEKLTAVAQPSPRAPVFGSDGRLYFLSGQDGKTAIWSTGMVGGAPPLQVTDNLDISGFKLSPQGDAVLVWANRPIGAHSLDDPEPSKLAARGSARVYDQLFVRHWDEWSDGKRSQIFIIPMVGHRAPGGGHAIEGALIGDSPSKPFGGGEELAWSADGRTVYFVLRQAGKNEAMSTNFDVFAAPVNGSAPPVNLTEENPAIDTLPAVSADGRWLAYAATSRAGYESDRKTLMLRELATGRVRPLTSSWDRSIDAIAWAPDSTRLYVTAADTLDHPVFQIDAVSGIVKRVSGEGRVSEIAALPGGGLIYLLDRLSSTADLWRVSPKGVASRLTAINASRLAGIDQPIVTRFSFIGAEGETVWGTVMRPASVSSGTKVPVAFFVHGGPQSTFGDAWNIRLNRTVWAGRGYASVAIDFHGSTGYGQAFTDSVNNDWGGKPLVDLQLGLKAATDRFAYLDPDRVCGIGGSYGGYMMNWIEGNWPDRFKCLVQANGVFDVRAMAYETDELWADPWDRGGHLYFEAPADWEKSNPVNFVAQWRTPQLVLTGEGDFRSPYTQAIAAFTALQLRGVPSRLVVFPDESHVVQKPANALQWYQEALRWMDIWLEVGIQGNVHGV